MANQAEVPVNEKDKITAEVRFPQEALDMAREVRQKFANSESLTIKTVDEFDFVRDQLLLIKKTFNDVDTIRKESTEPFRNATSVVNDLFRDFNEWAKQMEKTGKANMAAFQREEDRKAREAQAKADEQARKERERLQARAEKAAEKGEAEKAEALADAADVVVAKESKPEKLKGSRKVWNVAVEDKKAFLEYAINVNPMMLGVVDINENVLKKMVAAVGDPSIKIPGVKSSQDSAFSLRS